MNKTVAPAPSNPAPAQPPAAPKPQTKQAWLIARSHPDVGAEGRFVDLTADEAGRAPTGVLVKPTAEQLALRAR